MRTLAVICLAATLLHHWSDRVCADVGEPSPATGAGEPITQAQLRNVLGFLQSHDAERRASAYRACRDRGEDFRDTYEQLLQSALNHHSGAFRRVMERRLGRNLSEDTLTPALAEWKERAQEALAHIQTDHDKERGKLAEMDRLYASTASSWSRLKQAFPKQDEHEKWIAELETHATALREIAHELAPDVSSPDQPVDLPTLARELDLGVTLRDHLASHAETGRIIGALDEANETNARMNWASRDQKSFAAILNERRVIVGLRPLILDEKLSIASLGHSQEMAALGFFAHESPREENRTPVIRARNAGSDRFAGECIFMGSASPADAEQAWWYSCGHRLINYGSNISLLGIAVHQTHWTLMVGR